LQAVLDILDSATIREVVERLDRMAAEPERIEETIGELAVGAHASPPVLQNSF
jgi:hypothetical protein